MNITITLVQVRKKYSCVIWFLICILILANTVRGTTALSSTPLSTTAAATVEVDEDDKSRDNYQIDTEFNKGQQQQQKQHFSRQVQSDSVSIIGGTIAPVGKYPYIAYFGCCGGTLIRPDLVLTAAHCLRGSGGCIRVGSTVLIGGATTDSGTRHKVIRTIVHPNFPKYTNNTTDKNDNNDIAVVKLNCASKATTIKLNYDSTVPYDGANVTTAGFGSLNADTTFLPYNLREVTVDALPNRVCKDNYNNTIITFLGSSMICAGILDVGGKDSCYGDSGGPLNYIYENNDNTVQVGIVSGGISCASPIYPGVYTRISSYRRFIQSTIKEYSSPIPTYCTSL